MRMPRKLELSRVLDGHNALAKGNLTRKRIEQRGLSRTSATSHREILAQLYRARKQTRIPVGQRAYANKLLKRGNTIREFPDSEYRTINRNGWNHGVHTIPTWQARVHNGASLVYTPPQRRDNAIDDNAYLFVVLKYILQRMQTSRTLKESRTVTVHHNLAYAVILKQSLKRAQTHHIVKHLSNKLLARLVFYHQLVMRIENRLHRWAQFISSTLNRSTTSNACHFFIAHALHKLTFNLLL